MRILIFSVFLFVASQVVSAQSKEQYIRIADIVVDSAELENFKAAIKEGTATAVREEKGVIMLYSVYDKQHPTHVTVFEIYADKAAYDFHITTAHFKKYKAVTQHMVKSLKLTDVAAIALPKKEID